MNVCQIAVVIGERPRIAVGNIKLSGAIELEVHVEADIVFGADLKLNRSLESVPIAPFDSNNRSIQIIDFGLHKGMGTTMLSEFVFSRCSLMGR